MQYVRAAHLPHYAPWGANSGLNFLRANKRNNYLMSRMVRSGDSILNTPSHQGTLLWILSDMGFQYNLRTKVLSTESFKFPWAITFITTGRHPEQSATLLAAMNWNHEVDMNVKFLQQIGACFVQSECVARDGGLDRGRRLESCCVAKPVPVWHYSDKPSKLREWQSLSCY
jgi:hypothetical protein